MDPFPQSDLVLQNDKIRGFLRNRHEGADWAFFEELRSRTGWSTHIGYMDAYAMGLWAKNNTCVAYEIKVSRSDFLKDVSSFKLKQGVALRNSNEFYYVCPRKLIEIAEVPEIAGLMWADTGGIKVVKVAPHRELEGGSLDLPFTKAMLRVASTPVVRSPCWKYLGRDLKEEDLLAIAKEKAFAISDKEIEDRAKKKAASMRLGSYKAVKEITKAIGSRAFCDVFGRESFSSGVDDAWIKDVVSRIYSLTRIEFLTKDLLGSQIFQLKHIQKSSAELVGEIEKLKILQDSK